MPPTHDSTGGPAGVEEHLEPLADAPDEHARRQYEVARLGLRALGGASHEELFELAVHAAVDCLGVNYGAIMEWHPEDGQLLMLHAVGMPPEMSGRQRFPATPETPMGATVLEARPAVVHDWAHETRFPQNPVLAALGIRSGVGTVIPGHGRPYGALGVQHRQPRRYRDEDVAFLQGLANVLGTAIERDRAEAAVRHAARHDALTGLPGRAELSDRLDAALEDQRSAGGTRLAVLFVDVDGFKLANDTLGHAGGDELLRRIAERLRGALREHDVLARVGGDEFVAVCGGLSGHQELEAILARVQHAFDRPFSIMGTAVEVTAGLGAALAGRALDDASAVIARADAAMYEAKSRGPRQAVVFDHALRRRVQRRQVVERALRKAIADDGVRAVFQPIVRLEDGVTVGVESLCRLDGRRAPKPLEFIPVAERTGLVARLGWQVLDLALAAAAAWREAGDPLDVGVNVSPAQLRAADCEERVVEALDRHGFPASALVLEVTETALLEDEEVALGAVRRLRDLGARVALDDFGTGYSSLSHLQRFPITDVKLDRSFVATLGDSVSSRTIARAVLGIADELGLTLVAEGVERPEQRETLLGYGCRYAQGFLFSRPLPAERVRLG